jgi:hypothetical protein
MMILQMSGRILAKGTRQRDAQRLILRCFSANRRSRRAGVADRRAFMDLPGIRGNVDSSQERERT